MTVYLIVAVILFILARRNSMFTFISVCGLLFVLTAFRGYTVGTDTENYHMLFTGEASVDKAGEFAFLALYNGINALGLNYRWFLIITAALFWGQLFAQSFWEMRKTPVFPLLFVFLLGYCFMFFNISRQMIAVSLGLWVFFMIERNIKPVYILPVIFTTTIFHTSGLILLLALLLKKIKIQNGTVAILLVLTFLLPFFSPVTNMTDVVISRVELLSRFNDYLSSTNKEAFSVNRLLMNFLYIFISIRYPSITKDMYFKGIVFGIIILNLFPTSSFITRCGIYYLMGQIVLLPRYYQNGDQFDRVLVWGYSFAVFLSFVLNNNGGIVPYTFG